MIIEYNRPTTLAEALALLGRAEPITYPLAGGSALNRPSAQAFAVVDLQALGLDTIAARNRGKSSTTVKNTVLELGAMLTLQGLLEASTIHPLPAALLKAIEHEATYNLRQVASMAGTLVAAGGRSPFATALLALGTSLTLQPENETIGLGDLLPERAARLRGRLITQVNLPLDVRLAYEYVARTPADQPIVCAAAAAWPSGRTRVVLGGYGSAPLLVLDGTEAEGAELAACSAYSLAEDEWATAAYRQEIAGVLARRCVEQVSS